MLDIEEVLKDMARFIIDTGQQTRFEEWMIQQGHDQKTIDQYNELISELD